MLNTIIRYIQGYLLIQVTGYSTERFLNLCSRKQIYLWGLEPKENSYEMFITIRGFRKLKPILKKTRTKVTILNRFGLPFFFHKYRKRKVFFFGILFCVIFIYVMSLFVWNIHIEGTLTSSRSDIRMRFALCSTKKTTSCWLPSACLLSARTSGSIR